MTSQIHVRLSIEKKKELITLYRVAIERGELLAQHELASQFGVSQKTAGNILRAAGIPARTHEEANPARFDVEEAVRLYLSTPNTTSVDVARVLGKSQTAVYTHLKKRGVLRGQDPAPISKEASAPETGLLVATTAVSTESKETFLTWCRSLGSVSAVGRVRRCPFESRDSRRERLPA